MNKVFVYGSLKSGHQFANRLVGSTFLGPNQTEEACFEMLSFPNFPAVVRTDREDERAGCINGEIYAVDDQTLALLDMIEDNGFMYKRELVWVYNNNTACWMYLLNTTSRLGLAQVTPTMEEDGILSYTW